jgi:hypothetical protein
MGREDSRFSLRQAITMAGAALGGMRWSVASCAGEPTAPRDATDTGSWSNDNPALSPDGKHEEDGFVFSFVHEISQSEGLFVILDARQLSAAPLATVRLRRRVSCRSTWVLDPNDRVSTLSRRA